MIEYKIFRNALQGYEIEQARGCIQGDMLDYVAMKAFIEQTMLPTVNATLHSNIVYSKFRVSNNNNSVDAGAFHRDTMPVREGQSLIPVYTCLSYLDTTVMELIPGTHTNTHMSYAEALVTYPKSIRITLNPGDILIFNSSLIHRGVFTERLPQRRLIQVFNCFLNYEDFRLYSTKVMDVKGDETYSAFTSALFRYSFTEGLPNLFGYLNAATGGGSPPSCVPSKIDYFSSEGLCSRSEVGVRVQKINRYYINVHLATLPDDCRADYKYAKYNRQFYLYFALLLLVVAVVSYGAYKWVPLIASVARRFTRNPAIFAPQRRAGLRL